ncbi:response regulator [Capilliphycus salinus ALCB114379]|uniref:response regulator n=1 Tax=Capilliphycus salinus TaxID=2768948 RepID=UPI0039A4D60F
MYTEESTPYQRLAQELDRRCQRMATGDLCFSTHDKQGRFHLFYGRLLYVTGEFHRVRRWKRAVLKYCPDWQPSSALLSFDQNKPWEYQMLYEGVAREQITLTQAKVVIRQVCLEVLFCLARYTDISFSWEPYSEEQSQLSLGLTLSFREIEPIFTKAAQMQQQWQAAGLSSINPRLSPVSKKKLNPESLSGMARYLNGQFTLWDISLRTGKSVTTITRALVPLIKKGVLQLRQIPDLSTPLSATPPAISPSKPSPQTGHTPFLIACIDDSPVIAKSLQKILEPAGYKVVGILDPIKALAEIAEHKPDLIFLDLIMPQCKRLYRVSIFAKCTFI